MKKILWLEGRLTQIETWVLVASVLTMLVLATYNVAYRNVLVPIQARLGTSGPPLAVDEPPTPDIPSTPSADAAASGDPAPSDESGGFGGAPDEGEAPAAEAPKAPDKVDPSGGFGGSPDDGDEAAGGFGGAPDDDNGAAKPAVAVEDGAVGAGDGDGDAPAPPATPQVAMGGPPPEGSAAAWFIGVVNWLKLDWIDLLLRQFVLITGFLGAMLATARRKHINIDAVTRFLPLKGQRIAAVITTVASVIICAILAVAGANLVSIGLEFPRELLSWAEEWVFQLVFPISFGLLVVHFAIRTAEAAQVVWKGGDGDEGRSPSGATVETDAAASAGGES
jgi:TRAP-type C4-dicarboxylate transport system permease small subunit